MTAPFLIPLLFLAALLATGNCTVLQNIKPAGFPCKPVEYRQTLAAATFHRPGTHCTATRFVEADVSRLVKIGSMQVTSTWQCLLSCQMIPKCAIVMANVDEIAKEGRCALFRHRTKEEAARHNDTKLLGIPEPYTARPRLDPYQVKLSFFKDVQCEHDVLPPYQKGFENFDIGHTHCQARVDSENVPESLLTNSHVIRSRDLIASQCIQLCGLINDCITANYFPSTKDCVIQHSQSGQIRTPGTLLSALVATNVCCDKNCLSKQPPPTTTTKTTQSPTTTIITKECQVIKLEDVGPGPFYKGFKTPFSSDFTCFTTSLIPPGSELTAVIVENKKKYCIGVTRNKSKGGELLTEKVSYYLKGDNCEKEKKKAQKLRL